MSHTHQMPLGPVMLDVAGLELTAADRARLAHPMTGGVILFARNYESPAQLSRLTQEIHALRQPPLLIAIDQEGGRVQRARAGFTVLPAMRELGHAWDIEPRQGKHLAHQVGYVLAAELRAHGVDLSFAPVLDIDYGNSSVIGDRSFHNTPRGVCELGLSLLSGLREGGMSSVGKHFPGHGHVRADSHHEIPLDERSYEQIEATDMQPFRRLIEHGLGGIMPAHVVYTKVDDQPAGFSSFWLKTVLRERLGFGGMIFSDDLSMAGASGAGNVVDRARAALTAGCDMVLVCNDAGAADQLLQQFDYRVPATSLVRLARIHGRGGPESPVRLQHDQRYKDAVSEVCAIGVNKGELPLYR